MYYKEAREIYHLMEIGSTKEISRDVRDALMVILSRKRRVLKDLPKFVTKKIDNNGRYRITRNS